MPDYQTAHRLQYAVLWEFVRADSHGEPVVAAPVELEVRWVAKRREMIGPEGTPVAVDATAVVNRDVVVGSIMWLGKKVDLPAGTSSFGGELDAETLMQVVAMNRTSDIKQRAVRRTAALVRFRGTVPTVA